MILHCFLSLFTIYSNPKDSCLEMVKIYKNYQDFSNEKFHDKLCLDDKKNKISINYNFITLRLGNIRHTYSNDEIWGYQKGNEIFRFYNQGIFWEDYEYVRVLEKDKSGLVIYSKKERYYSSFNSREHYFYSKNLESPIKKLSLKNLKEDYQNSDFIRQILLLDNLMEKDNNGNYIIDELYKNITGNRIWVFAEIS